MKIYGEVPSNYFSLLVNRVEDDDDIIFDCIKQPSIFDTDIDGMMISAKSSQHIEVLRLAFAHLLSKPDFDLATFFRTRIDWSDEELRTIIGYAYRRAWPDAAWPIPPEDYKDVEFVGAPGPTWAPRISRWGPDAPPAVGEKVVKTTKKRKHKGG